MRYQTMPGRQMQGQEMLLPLERILPRPSLQYAQEPVSLRRLTDAIRLQGLRKPLIVRRSGEGRYIVIAGNRRLLACRMLGMQQAPVRVLPADMRWQPADGLLEMLLTRWMHYLEQAEVLRALHEAHGVPVEELAGMTGMHPRTVTELIRLTATDEELRATLLDEGVPLSIALTLLRLPDVAVRRTVLQRIVRERLCVRDAALVVGAELHRKTDESTGVTNREETATGEESQNTTRKVVGVIRDQRLYINALRDITGQMQAAGVRVSVSERQQDGHLEMTIRVPLRRRRAARYQSM